MTHNTTEYTDSRTRTLRRDSQRLSQTCLLSCLIRARPCWPLRPQHVVVWRTDALAPYRSHWQHLERAQTQSVSKRKAINCFYHHCGGYCASFALAVALNSTFPRLPWLGDSPCSLGPRLTYDSKGQSSQQAFDLSSYTTGLEPLRFKMQRHLVHHSTCQLLSVASPAEGWHSP